MRPENNALEVFIRMMMVVVVRKRKTEDAQTDGKTRLKMKMAQGQRPVIFSTPPTKIVWKIMENCLLAINTTRKTLCVYVWHFEEEIHTSKTSTYVYTFQIN